MTSLKEHCKVMRLVLEELHDPDAQMVWSELLVLNVAAGDQLSVRNLR